MTVKRPPIDLMALTSDQAAPMPEAAQRATVHASPTAGVGQGPAAPKHEPRTNLEAPPPVRTENLEGLAFKVSPDFRKRFRSRAVAADLKFNELLFAALDAWEETQGIKK